MAQISDNFVIISAFRGRHTQAENLLAHYELYRGLHKACDVEPTLVLGKYNDALELSYLVDLRRNPRLYSTVLDMAQHFNQENVLRVVSGRASLISQVHDSMHIHPIGQWQPVHADYAMTQHAYSRVGSQYYICKGK